jgi:fluoride ion exporter CrcB/FEX
VSITIGIIYFTSLFHTGVSTFANENLQFFQNGNYILALGYTLASVVLGILAVWLGMMVMKT